jgi:hypothetical protein
VDGLAGLTNIPAARALRLTAYALADLAGSLLDRPQRYLPISVPPGQLGVIATDDAMVGMARLDPGDGSWSNEITARSLLDVTLNRPVKRARNARCPLLMVVAEHDTMAPTDRHWPWPRAHPAESYTAAAADNTTSTPAGLTTRTCYESRHPSCTDTPKYLTSEAIPSSRHRGPTSHTTHSRPCSTAGSFLPPSRRRSLRVSDQR